MISKFKKNNISNLLSQFQCSFCCLIPANPLLCNKCFTPFCEFCLQNEIYKGNYKCPFINSNLIICENILSIEQNYQKSKERELNIIKKLVSSLSLNRNRIRIQISNENHQNNIKSDCNFISKKRNGFYEPNKFNFCFYCCIHLSERDYKEHANICQFRLINSKSDFNNKPIHRRIFYKKKPLINTQNKNDNNQLKNNDNQLNLEKISNEKLFYEELLNAASTTKASTFDISSFIGIDSFRISNNNIYSDNDSEIGIVSSKIENSIRFLSGYCYKHISNKPISIQANNKLSKSFLISLLIRNLSNHPQVRIGFSCSALNYSQEEINYEWALKSNCQIIENNFDTLSHETNTQIKQGDLINFFCCEGLLLFDINNEKNDYQFKMLERDKYFTVTLATEGDEIELLHN